MATIESQIGTVASGQSNPLKKYIVDDPTANNRAEPEMDEPSANPYYKQPVVENKKTPQETEEERIYLQFQEAKRTKNQITPESKRKIEALLGLRKIVKSITIDGVTITLRNLNVNDTKIAFKTIAANSATNIDLMFSSRNVSLALSLYEINGEKVSNLLNEENGPDIDLRLSLIEELSEDVVKELQSFYEKEIGVKIPQTEEETKEVNSEIKK